MSLGNLSIALSVYARVIVCLWFVSSSGSAASAAFDDDAKRSGAMSEIVFQRMAAEIAGASVERWWRR